MKSHGQKDEKLLIMSQFWPPEPLNKLWNRYFYKNYPLNPLETQKISRFWAKYNPGKTVNRRKVWKRSHFQIIVQSMKGQEGSHFVPELVKSGVGVTLYGLRDFKFQTKFQASKIRSQFSILKS